MMNRIKTAGLLLGAALLVSSAAAYASETEETGRMTGAYEAFQEEGLSDEAGEAFNLALENYEGKEAFTPLQLLASQIVSGVNYRVLCSVSTPDGPDSKAVVTVYRNLDGHCEITDVQKVISPADQSIMLDAADFSAKAAFLSESFNWEDQTLTCDLYTEALYDMVDMTRLEIGDVIEVNDQYITVNTMDKGVAVRRDETGAEEKIASLVINRDTAEERYFEANEGGTWITIMDNDHRGLSLLGTKTLPLSDSLTFTDCDFSAAPNTYFDVPSEDLRSYMDGLADSYSGQYDPFSTHIEVTNGEITAINRSWMP